MKKLELTKMELDALFTLTGARRMRSGNNEERIFYKKLQDKVWAVHPNNPNNKVINK